MYIKPSTSYYAKTSTPKATARKCACAARPNVSVKERSSSAPILVSDASIADLERHFKKCSKSSASKSSTSSNCSRRESATVCIKTFSPRVNEPCPRVCTKEQSPRVCPQEHSPRVCPQEHSPRVCTKEQSPRVCTKELSPRVCTQEQSPRVCVKEEPPMHCEETQAPVRADKAGCVEELYFNNEAKKSGASSPGGHCINEYAETGEAKANCAVVTQMKNVMNRSCGKIKTDSSGMCSLAESASATCDASMRAQYYQNKLMSTLQILQNKEETIRVQAQSLAVAESRIATLTERTIELKRELDRKNRECQRLLKSANSCKVEKSDVCIVTDQLAEDQSDMVRTLETNLSIIQELYRECFYETAKQESLIDMLRSSYLDVRLMERQKTDQIGRLQTVIDSQKWSLNRYQDIASEVDSLKMEISNFLHSSTSTNNDSGMWERSEESLASVPAVHDELRDVTELLLRLRELLTTGCTCGLEEENMRLKREIEKLDTRIGEMRTRICELECLLVGKTSEEAKYEAEIQAKEKELASIKEQLKALEDGSRDQNFTCDAMSAKLRHTEALLSEKTTEMEELQKQNEANVQAVKKLQEELQKADQLIGENCKMRSEVSYLTKQVSLWRDQLSESERRVRTLENELARCREQCTHINACYRQKASSVAELQAHLEEAHARGTALCGEARRAVTAVRAWMRRMRRKQREQENIIKEKDALLTALQQRLEEIQSESQRTSVSGSTPTCSKCQCSRDSRRLRFKVGERQNQSRGLSINEMPSCSSSPVSTTHGRVNVITVKSCGNKGYSGYRCDGSVQAPTRQDASSETIDPGDPSAPSGSSGRSGPYCTHRDVKHVRLRVDHPPRDVSPTEELLLRVEQLTEAMADGHRRWTRPHDAR